MTIKNAIEIIRQQFPEFGDTQIIKDLDLSQKLFASETRVNVKFENRTTITTTATEKGLRIALPTNTLEIQNVKFFDVDDNELEYYFTWDSEGIFITDLEKKLLVLPTEIIKINIQYLKIPNTLTTITDSFELGEDYHYAFLADTLQRYFAFAGNLNGAGFWKQEYSRYLLKAKKQANQLSGGNIIAKGEISL